MLSKKGLLMNLVRYVILIGCVTVLLVDAQSARWSWFYAKTVAEESVKNSAETQVYLFSRLDVPLFSQLIFSWNAHRPVKGYFSFWVQTRNAHTKKWGKWHRMMDWGANVQKSYMSDGDGHTKYVHVRLEHERHTRSDAFRIKLCAHAGADLSTVQTVAVALADYDQFEPEKIRAIKQLRSVYVPGVPKISQMKLDHPDYKRLCSPTSCWMLTRYLSGHAVSPEVFADNVFDEGLEVFGSWPFNIAHSFEQGGGNNCFFIKRLHNFAELHRQLCRGLPVVVSVRGMIHGAPKAYDNGHLLVVVGWDNKRNVVICHDPALSEQKKVLKRYPIESFIRAWERSYRLVYWVEPMCR